MTGLGAERKYVVGVDGTFVWVSPHNLDTSTPPVLSVYLSGGTVTPVFAAVRTTLACASIANDRRVITLDALASVEGQAGPWGDAYLETAEAGVFPIRVVDLDVSAKTVTLADTLPRVVDVAGATIRWAAWTATLTNAAVTAAKARNIRWAVAYTERAGDDAPTVARRQTGLLHVVYQPFTTGLTTSLLLDYVPSLPAPSPNQRQQDWGPQIRAAEGRLVNKLRADLAERGLYEDDVHDAERLQLAHAYLVAAMYYEASNQAQAESMFTMFGRVYAEVMRVAALDLDGDGEVDADEVGQRVTGGAGSDVGGTATSLSTTHFPVFSRRMNH